MRRMLLAVALFVTTAVPARAQWIVNDPSVTLQNRLTAATKELLLRLQQDQNGELRRMARRLSAAATMSRFRLLSPPRWRTHIFRESEILFGGPYTFALNYGDQTGRGFIAVSQPVEDASAVLAGLSPASRRALLSQLATLDLADATTIAATNETGRLRFNGRRELRAINALERDVTNDSAEESTTAILDKMSGAGLIGARQRQARIQLLDGLVEQLLVESKRSRDTEAAAMNMQLVTWRVAAAANRAFAEGAGEALRTWRQP